MFLSVQQRLLGLFSRNVQHLIEIQGIDNKCDTLPE